MNRVAQKFILGFRNRVYHKLQSQSLAYLQRQRTGDLMSRAMGDVDELQSFIVNGIDVIIGEGVMWLVTVVIVMLLDWRVASASLAPLIVVYLLLRIFNQRVAADLQGRPRAAGRCLDAIAGESVRRRRDQDLRPREAGGRAVSRGDRGVLRSADQGDQRAQPVLSRSAAAVGFLSNVFMIGVGGYSILQPADRSRSASCWRSARTGGDCSGRSRRWRG